MVRNSLPIRTAVFDSSFGTAIAIDIGSVGRREETIGLGNSALP